MRKVQRLYTIDEYNKPLRKAWLNGNEYNHGLTKPRYSVPAIRERCTIWHDRVLWSRDGGRNTIPMVSGYFTRTIGKRT